MKIASFAAALALAAALAAPALAAPAKRLSLGAAIGANGATLEAAYALSRHLVLRGQGAFLDFDHDFKSSDATYTGKVRSNTGGGFLDLHPWANPFTLSVGLVHGKRRVKVTAHPAAATTYKINGVTYTASQVVAVDGAVDLGSTAPFVGVGFDNSFTTQGHWGVRALAGVIVGRDPKVSQVAQGPLANTALVQSNLAAEQTSLQKDVKDLRYYPVAQVGVTYNF